MVRLRWHSLTLGFFPFFCLVKFLVFPKGLSSSAYFGFGGQLWDDNCSDCWWYITRCAHFRGRYAHEEEDCHAFIFFKIVTFSLRWLGFQLHVALIMNPWIPGGFPGQLQEYLTGRTRADQVYSDRGWYGEAWTMVGTLKSKNLWSHVLFDWCVDFFKLYRYKNMYVWIHMYIYI